MYKALALTLALGLAACASNREARHIDECTKLGVGPGKPGYADCRLRLKQVDATITAGILASD